MARKMSLQSFVVLAMLFAANSVSASPSDGAAVQKILGDGKVQCQFPNGETNVYVNKKSHGVSKRAVDAAWVRRNNPESYASSAGSSAGYQKSSQPDVESDTGSPVAYGDNNGKSTLGYGSEGQDGSNVNNAPVPQPDQDKGEHSPDAIAPQDAEKPPCCEEMRNGVGGWTLMPPASVTPPADIPSGNKPPQQAGQDKDADVDSQTPASPSPVVPDHPSDSPEPAPKHDQPAASVSAQPDNDDHKDKPVDEDCDEEKDKGEGTFSPPAPSQPEEHSDNHGKNVKPTDEDCDEGAATPSAQQNTPSPAIPQPSDDQPAPPAPSENKPDAPTEDKPAQGYGSTGKDADSPPETPHKHHKHKHHDSSPAPPTWAVDVPEYRDQPSSPHTSAGKGNDETSSPGSTPGYAGDCQRASCKETDGPSSPARDDSPMCGPPVAYSDLVRVFVPASNNSSASPTSPAITSGGNGASAPGSDTPANTVAITSGGGSASHSSPVDIPSGGGSVPPSGGASANGTKPGSKGATTDSDASPSNADAEADSLPKTPVEITSGGASAPLAPSSSDSTPAIASGGAASADNCDGTCPANSVSKFEFKTCEFVALIQRMQLSAAQVSVFESGLKAMLDNSLASYTVDSSGNGAISASTGSDSFKGSYLDSAIDNSISQAMGNVDAASNASHSSAASDSKSAAPAALPRNLQFVAPFGQDMTSSSHLTKRSSRLLRIVRRH